MATQIIGNQINQVTRAIMEALQVTEQINLPNLNQTQINALGTPAYGTLVYNSTEDMAQIYLQDAAQGTLVGMMLVAVVPLLVKSQLLGLMVLKFNKILLLVLLLTVVQNLLTDSLQVRFRLITDIL